MSTGQLSRRQADLAKGSRTAPVVVLAYAGSGADRLRRLLSASTELTCTTGTGVVPLCYQALTAWQGAEGRAEDRFSPLALASVKALTMSLITVILARGGGRRWCEFVAAPPAAAETFARIYPQTQFLIVHRRADAAVRAIIDSHRWGLSGPEYAPFMAAHPASTVAALTSYWISHTTQRLEFEQAHSESCLRVRVEDLVANAAQATREIGEFLSVEDVGGPPCLDRDEDTSGPAAAGLPLDQIPVWSLARLNELHRQSGYPPLTSAGA